MKLSGFLHKHGLTDVSHVSAIYRHVRVGRWSKLTLKEKTQNTRDARCKCDVTQNYWPCPLLFLACQMLCQQRLKSVDGMLLPRCLKQVAVVYRAGNLT